MCDVIVRVTLVVTSDFQFFPVENFILGQVYT